MKQFFALALVQVAYLASASSLVLKKKDKDGDRCCTLYTEPDFDGDSHKLCLGKDKGEDIGDAEHKIDFEVRSVKCGKHVHADLCPYGAEYGSVPGQAEQGYKCREKE